MKYASRMSAYALEFANLSVTFRSREDHGQGYTAVADTTLHVRAGEFVSVVGPTGCGKSTLLNIGAGLLEPSSGAVLVFGQPLQGINRRAGSMFQTEALMPWRDAIAAGRDRETVAPAHPVSGGRPGLRARMNSTEPEAATSASTVKPVR